MFFKKEVEETQDFCDQYELIYNPDPFVNRMNLIIRLIRELEVSSVDVSKELLYDSIKLTLKSLRENHKEEDTIDVHTITH